MLGGVRDFVDADHHQSVEPATIELVSDDPLEDLADRPPRDPHQLRQRRPGHLLRQERDHVLYVPRVRGAGPRPRHHLRPVATTRATKTPKLALDHAPRGAEIQMPPALHAPILDLQPHRPAARTDPPPAPQPNRHDHSFAAERHVLHRRPRQAEHPVECGADPHVVLLVVADLQTASSLLQGTAAGRRVARKHRERTTPQGIQPSAGSSAEPRSAPHPHLVRRADFHRSSQAGAR